MALIGQISEWFQRWRAMRALRSIDHRLAQDHYWDVRNLLAEARTSFESGNLRRANEIWEKVKKSYPDLLPLFGPALEICLSLRNYDDAEALMTRGLAMNPRHPHCMEGLARIAYERGDTSLALERCASLRKAFPGSAIGYVIAAAALAALDRVEEAEAILAPGLRALPENDALCVKYAQMAEQKGDWNAALQRWRDIDVRFHHIIAVSSQARALKELGRYDEADALLEGVKHRSGNDTSIWAESARIREHQGDWAGASERWAGFRKRFPLEPFGYVWSLVPLLALNQQAEADQMLRDGIYVTTENPRLMVEYAWLAQKRQDWSEAEQRWAAVRVHHPELRDAIEQGAVALDQLGRAEEAAQLRAS